MGLRHRLDRLETNAHSTMNQGQAVIQVAKEILKDIEENGIDITLIKKPGITIMQFLSGEVQEFPFGIKIKFRDD